MILPPALPHFGMPVPMEHPWLPGFLEPLIVTPLDDGTNWRVVNGFQYETAIIMAPYGALVIEIPDAFETDFASTPRFLWPVLPPTGPWGRPAVLHDYLYRTFGLATFDQANDVFREAMGLLSDHIPAWKRFVMYEGVALFGRRSYKGGLG